MTKKILKIVALSALFLFAHTQLLAENKAHILTQEKIEQLDRKMTTHQAHQRHFNTIHEYKKYKKEHFVNHAMSTHKPLAYRDTGYSPFPFHRYREYGQPHRHPKRGWVLAYKDDRAGFYDRDGFYYGYFNRYGYFFNGIFYRYDRFYSYGNRMRGRGLFDYDFYRPAAYRYYGFCR